MEKHVKLVGILNIVYRGVVILGAIVLFMLAAAFGYIMKFLERKGELRGDEVPREILDIVPLFLVIIGIIMVVVSIVAIIGAVGVLRRQEWGRIVLIVISFFNLIRVPLGTVLGVYTLWVLLNDEIVRLFSPAPTSETPKAAT
jgi:hypothetical protein